MGILGIGFLSFANRFPNSTTKTGMDVLLICTLIISVLFIVVMLVFETYQIVRRRRNKGGNKDGDKDGNKDGNEDVSFSSVEQEERVEDEVAVVASVPNTSSSLSSGSPEEDVEKGGAGEKEKTANPALVYVDTLLEKALDEAVGEVNSVESALALLDSVVTGVQLSDHDNWEDDQALHGDIGLLGISRHLPDVSESCGDESCGDESCGDESCGDGDGDDDDDDDFTFVTVDSDSESESSSIARRTS